MLLVFSSLNFFKNVKLNAYQAINFSRRMRLCFDESGSNARNQSARISTARHFFQESRLLDRKMASARQKKVCRTYVHTYVRAVDKKKCNCSKFRADDKIIETVKSKSSIFFIQEKKKPNLT